MILLYVEHTTDDIARVSGMHFQPEILPQELIDTGVLVDSIPPEIPATIEEYPVLWVNKITKEMSYTLAPKMLSPEQQEIVDLRKQLETTQAALDFIIMNMSNPA